MTLTLSENNPTILYHDEMAGDVRVEILTIQEKTKRIWIKKAFGKFSGCEYSQGEPPITYNPEYCKSLFDQWMELK